MGEETKSIRRKTMEIAVPQLPQDVVMNILSRLPVKYLTQLKCICKPWRSLISDPHFAKLQLAQSKNSCHRSLFLGFPLQTLDLEASVDDHHHVGYLNYPVAMNNPPEDNSSIVVRGSCNGLICIDLSDGRTFLWNPTIREALELPNTATYSHPKLHYLDCGLGYDSSIDDYKLLRGRYRDLTAGDFSVIDFEILQMKRNVWRKVEEPKSDYLFEGLPKTGIFLRGALHWPVKTPTEIFVILVFDKVEEKFDELVELPNTTEETELYAPVLQNSGDSVFMLWRDRYGQKLEAWHLKEYGVKSSWTKIFSKECTIPELEVWRTVLFYRKTGKVLLDYGYGTNELVWYDPEENTCDIVPLPPTDWE